MYKENKPVTWFLFLLDYNEYLFYNKDQMIFLDESSDN